MVRALFASLLCAIVLNGADLKADLEALIQNRPEQIEIILKNSNTFMDARANVNYSALLAHLRSLGLLEVQNSENLTLGFSCEQEDAILMINSVSKVLKNMGYKYFSTSWFENSPAIWRISLSSRANLDVGILYNEFLKHGIFIKKLQRDGNSFIYELDLNNASVKSDELLVEPIRPKSAYFLNVSGKKMINISANIDDTWQPFVRIFDKKLRLIKTQEIKIKTENLRLELPNGAAYALIDDLYSLENIKHGLSINLE